MENNSFDRMVLACAWCGHVWKFISDKTGTDKQINWFRTYEKEHCEVCKIYRILKDVEEK